jgi:catechol 2,3-dioxygenase-like lactoylglutathione lyase family enzyme
MLLSLDHVTVRSADFDRTEHFYCDVLGLRPGPRPNIAVPGRWFYLGDEAVLHVLPRTAQAAHEAQGTIDHFALKADDPPAFEQRLRAAGQPFESRRLADSTWQIFLTDPDGARVELSFEAGQGQAQAQDR